MSQSRAWVFTDNVTERYEDDLQLKWPEFPRHIRYVVWQLEAAPTTGQLHYQGYMQMLIPTRLNWMKQVLPGARFAVAEGSLEENQRYCKRDDKRVEGDGTGPWEYGKPTKQGGRSDLEAIAIDVLAGMSMRDIAIDHPSDYIRYHRGLWAFRDITVEPAKRDGFMALALVGRPGTGKSRYVSDRHGGRGNCWLEDDKAGWMGDYVDEKTIVFDEFMGNFPLGSILRLVSQAPFVQRIKGGHRHVTADRVVFTSNTNPKDWYPESAAWARRVDEPWFITIEVDELSTVEEIEDRIKAATIGEGERTEDD